MFVHLRPLLYLFIILLILTPTLFLAELTIDGGETFGLARQLMTIAIIYFTFTLIELLLGGLLKKENSSLVIGLNLGFSLLRLFLTIGLLFYFKHQFTNLFIPSFLNVLVFYLTTLLFSTWWRYKESHHPPKNLS